jgi:hypothetical protein
MDCATDPHDPTYRFSIAFFLQLELRIDLLLIQDLADL